MLRKMAILVCLVMVVSLLPWHVLALETEKIVRITHYQKVNVRKGPGTGYGVRGEVRPGDTFRYLGEEDGWYCIQYTESKKGWVWHEMAEVETVYSGSVSFAKDEEGYVHITNRNRVNVRSGPGTGYKVIGEAKPGDWYTYHGTTKGWHLIQFEPGVYGYVANNMSEVEGRQYEVDQYTGTSKPDATSGATSDSPSNNSSIFKGR